MRSSGILHRTFRPNPGVSTARLVLSSAPCALIGLCLLLSSCLAQKEFVLFDGTGLEGWKSNEETPGVFSVTPEGELKVEGGRAHLFWAGTGSIPPEFQNFEFTARVKTTPGANSGIFFHTAFQEKGWPKKGYEAQVNSSHPDPRKTGSLYAIQDILNDSPSTDGTWFTYTIRVEDRNITVLVDEKIVNEYTEPENAERPPHQKGILLGKGTFALQGHDPKSVTYYKDIRVRELP